MRMLSKYDPLDERIFFKDEELKFEMSQPEMEHYRQLQVNYLREFKSTGLEIPPDK